MPKYNGVDVEHPLLKEGVKNAIRRQYSTENIIKILDVPHEVVKRIEHEMERKKEQR